MQKVMTVVFLIVAFAAPLSARDAAITGDYLEVRTADVYTGPCFANAEVNLTGKEAILAWRVRQGRWQGVELDNLVVVAIVKASATLGDPHANPYPARSVVVIDETATARQQEALLHFARSMGGPLLEDVVQVEHRSIEFEAREAFGYARLEVEDVARLETRALNHRDHLCGNEEIYYPPLTTTLSATPAYTLDHRFTGQGLNSNWSSPGKRSAFIGSFSR